MAKLFSFHEMTKIDCLLLRKLPKVNFSKTVYNYQRGIYVLEH